MNWLASTEVASRIDELMTSQINKFIYKFIRESLQLGWILRFNFGHNLWVPHSPGGWIHRAPRWWQQFWQKFMSNDETAKPHRFHGSHPHCQNSNWNSMNGGIVFLSWRSDLMIHSISSLLSLIFGSKPMVFTGNRLNSIGRVRYNRVWGWRVMGGWRGHSFMRCPHKLNRTVYLRKLTFSIKWLFNGRSRRGVEWNLGILACSRIPIDQSNIGGSKWLSKGYTCMGELLRIMLLKICCQSFVFLVRGWVN